MSAHSDELVLVDKSEVGPEVSLDRVREQRSPVPIATRHIVRCGRKENGPCKRVVSECSA